MVESQSSVSLLETLNSQIAEINSLTGKLQYVMTMHLSDDKLIFNRNDNQIKFDQCKIVKSIIGEINKDFAIPLNYMIKYLKFTNPELIKTVEFLIGNKVINQWHSSFTNFNEPIPIIYGGLHNNAIYGVFGLIYISCMIRVTKHDNVISNHDDITCILDLYEPLHVSHAKTCLIEVHKFYSI